MDTKRVACLERLYNGERRAEDLVACPPQGEAAVFSMRAPAKETANEDAAAILSVDSNWTLLAVADGVGGHPEGEKAAMLALRTLCDAVIAAMPDTSALQAAILAGIDEANQAVIALGSGAATTIAIAEIRGNAIRSYHAGDSGVLIFGGRGKVKLQTIAHSPVGYALEAGMLDEPEAMEHEERHMVSNVVGDPAMHLGVSSPVPLSPRDTVVVASDGLFDNLYTDEIVELLRRGPLSRAVRSIAEECSTRMVTEHDGQPCKPDDLTLLAYRRTRTRARRGRTRRQR